MSGPLSKLKVAVDVQHLYRLSKPGDQGAVFELKDGTHVTEASATTLYAGALVSYLRERGASVLTNDPVRGTLVSEYWDRQRNAIAWGARAYLACHLDAGRGRYGLVERMRGDVSTLAAFLAGSLCLPPHPPQGARMRSLMRGDRGAVCIEGFRNQPSLILEPFFGDDPESQALLQGPNLAAIGVNLGRAVEAWWLSGTVAGSR